MELVHCRSRHRKMKESVSGRRIERLTEMLHVLELDEDSQFTGKRFSSLPRIKEAHEDLQVLRMMKTSFEGRKDRRVPKRGGLPRGILN